MSESEGVWYGLWHLTGKDGERKLTRYNGDHEAVEWLFEVDGWSTFSNKLKELKALKPEPARPKTTVDVKLVHLVRKEGAPLDGPTNVVYGPIDTANDAIIIAHLLNTKCDLLDEGEQFEAVTRKTTVEVTIL